jgi:nucleoid-associated protein YgaU
MNRDFKIGVAMGLCLIAAVSLWLAIQLSLSVKARMDEGPILDQPPVTLQYSAATIQPSPPATDSVESTFRIHVVQRGETLSAISQRYYGSVNKWQKILDANHKTLKNPNNLTPGMKLIIPD